jgi:hypothetical protein
MTDVVLKGLFFQNARGMRIADSGTVTWSFDSPTNTLSAEAAGGPGGTIDSDVYTPTLTNAANLDGSTAYECQWMQIGDIVSVSGKVSVNPTAPATETRLGIELPVASNFGAEEDCGGVAFASGIAGQGGGIRADAANNRAELVFIAGDLSNQPMYFQFQYQVI